MNTFITVACCLVGAALASSSYDSYEAPKDNGAYVYHGKYPGECSYDGLYYNDETSFIFCTHGFSYNQKCSPGTRNSAYSKFSYGESYSTRDFCDVNLIKDGYVAQYAPKYEEPSYAEPAKYPEPAGYDGPSYEEPKYEPAGYDAPSYEPKYEEPSYAAPKYEEPSYAAPKYEEPSYSAPKYEEPSGYDAPKYEEPKEKCY